MDKHLLHSMKLQFEDIYGEVPTIYARIPGRVNLIGEHIDYCGYAVCPMAIKTEIIVAARISDSTLIVVKNMNKKYADYSCEFNNIKISYDGCTPPFWADYFLCGIKGIQAELPDHEIEGFGMNVLVSGNIPECAGLSSSSALVCAGILALTGLKKLKYDKLKLAEIAAYSERFIGTIGGGMDHAIIFAAKLGCVSHVSFDPLIMNYIKVPDDATFVIARSLVTKNKAASSDFNTRVIECRLACLVLAKKSTEHWARITVLANLQITLHLELDDMIKMVQKELHEAPYSKDEICEILELSPKDLDETYLTQNTRDVLEFKLYQRALHVFQEALRVQQFHSCCFEHKDETLEAIGRLMNESHESLKNLYECSHPQVDKLVEICLEKGAFGARITGAGWGGCVVALITYPNYDTFIKAVRAEFYVKHLNTTENSDGLIFASEAFPGAEICNLDD